MELTFKSIDAKRGYSGGEEHAGDKKCEMISQLAKLPQIARSRMEWNGECHRHGMVEVERRKFSSVRNVLD